MPAIALSMLVGLLAGFWVPAPGFWFPGCLTVAMMLLLWFRSTACVFLFAAYIAAACYGLEYLAARLPGNLEGRDIIVRGCIDDFVSEQGRSRSFPFTVAKSHSWTGQMLKLRLSLYDPALHIEGGQCWQWLVRLKAPHGRLNPGGFDRELWLFRSGQVATGYVRASSLNHLLTRTSGASWLLGVRRSSAADMASLSDSSELTAILQGITTGVRGNLSAHQWQVFRATGTSHLMAISGLHIGLVAWFCWAAGFCVHGLCVLTGSRLRCEWLGGILGAVGAVCYALLGGWSIPTQRAVWMVLVVLLIRARCRLLSGATLLAWAVVLVLAVDVTGILSGGFWLSFIAVACLAVFAVKSPGTSGGISRFKALLQAQFVLFISLAIPTVFLFEGLSLIAPLANLLAVPLFSFLVLPLTLLSMLLLPFSITGAHGLLTISTVILGVLFDCLEKLAEFPGVWVKPGLIDLAIILFLAVVLILGVSWRYRLISIVPVLLICFVPTGITADKPLLRIVVLDVGQGLAVLVMTSAHNLLYDTGPAWEDGDAGESVVVPAIMHSGIDRLDALILSHGDNDHRGGLNSVVKQLPVSRLIVPPEFATDYHRADICLSGMRWTWDGVDFEILHPRNPAGWSDNNASCVLKISVAGTTVLLPGDIELEAERVLLSRWSNPEASLIVAPHHGSRTSSSNALVTAVRPEYVVFTTGYANRWGFPARLVMERYEAAGACLLNTAVSGSLDFSVQANSGLSLHSPLGIGWHRPWALRKVRQSGCETTKTL